MAESTLELVGKAAHILDAGGPYVIIIVLGYVIYKLWKTNEELHKRLEKK